MGKSSITMDTLLDFIDALEGDVLDRVTEFLDEHVCDGKAAEASEINNCGPLTQLEYILGDPSPSEEALQDMLSGLKYAAE